MLFEKVKDYIDAYLVAKVLSENIDYTTLCNYRNYQIIKDCAITQRASGMSIVCKYKYIELHSLKNKDNVILIIHTNDYHDKNILEPVFRALGFKQEENNMYSFYFTKFEKFKEIFNALDEYLYFPKKVQ